MKISVHIVTQTSNSCATIIMIVDKAKIEYDATHRQCTIEAKNVSIICDNGDAREWNTSCTPNVYTYYDVLILKIE